MASKPTPIQGRAGLPAGRRVAAAVDEAWTGLFHTGADLHIPASVVAALTLCGRRDPDGPDPAVAVAQLDTGELAELLRNIWRGFVLYRADLAVRVMPLVGWLYEQPSDWQLEGARTVARAALRAGVMDLPAHPDDRRGTDVFGELLQHMRSHRTKAGRGEFYTPLPVAELLADIGGVAELQDGQSLLEPTAGTGVMLCAAAQTLRRQGRDPAAITWYANDIDPITAACLAVNAHLWGLGWNVLIGCANGLDQEWPEQARQDRAASITAVRSVQAVAQLRRLEQALQINMTGSR